LNEKKIEELQKRSDDVYKNKLTGTVDNVETERGALASYTERGYMDMNGVSHDPLIKEKYKTFDFSDWSQVERANECLDSALAKFNLESDITVFRGDKSVYFEGWEPGTIKCYPAFMSTSLSERVADEWVRGIKLEILVPKGTCGLYIGTHSAVRKNEAEFLLGRGLKFKVLERTANTIKMEVLP